ncbi:hypothetical protein EIP91_002349 [Steccherinum ochraceum]|uniref:F-box domain-containing protein n=1 Tax=Steccherinum ochraceum TaxID=92696 RepID=A0A4R0RP70_9APHY|nr:hypothetical protein EIP91_002349 [Steccherinum ochraceum]
MPSHIKKSSHRHIASLPAETLDHIVNLLWDDFRSLTSASLACRAWHALARPYIFRSVTVGDETSVYKLGQKLEEIPALAYWVRELRISHHGPTARFYFWHLWTSNTLYSVTSRLKKLYTITLTGHNIPFHENILPDELTTLTRRLSLFNTVQELSIISRSSIAPHLLLPLTRCLANLHSIEFVDSWSMLQTKVHGRRFAVTTKTVSPSSAFKDIPYGNPPSLTSLRIVGHEGPPIRKLFPPESLQSVEVLHFDDSGGDWYTDAPYEVPYAIQHAGRSVRDLRIAMPKDGRRTKASAKLLSLYDSLTNLEALDTFSLKDILVLEDASLATILTKLAPTPVQTITLSIKLEVFRRFFRADYAALEQAFEKPSFERLRVLRVAYKGKMTSERVYQRVKMVFRCVVERGIRLEFVGEQVPSAYYSDYD